MASFMTPKVSDKKREASLSRFDEGMNGMERDLDFNKSRGQYDVIVERNIFDSTNKVANIGKPKDDGRNAAPRLRTSGPPVLSSLPIKLMGTLVSSSSALSIATISVSGKPDAEQFGVGDRIMGQATITSIERNRVYLTNSGAKEYIETDDAKGSNVAMPFTQSEPIAMASAGAGIKETAPGKYTVDKSRIEQVMSNLNEVMTQARVVPHFDNGKPAGWKIFAIKPNSIYQELNLQNGDIIQRINGVEVDSPAKALEMYQQLASESHISMDVIRNGMKQSFDYDIK
jgi:general secretion pathway protein C